MPEYLTPGSQAPDFSAKDQDGQTQSLSALKGSKVVLYFYPKDDTPGCTKQACNIRDNYSALTEKGIKLFGVSVDDEKSHQKFIHKFSLPFPLLADTEHDIVNAYKVWVEKNMYGKKYMGTARVTYLIDEKGIISHVIEKVDVENHTEQILKLIS
ncbi:MAG: thioredoxin-dependent thiol peroxidase [Sphingobacteriia bacterium]|nr:thioredoxin-dependent thiol peroxidase [Sphingobacteriia bacterium]